MPYRRRTRRYSRNSYSARTVRTRYIARSGSYTWKFGTASYQNGTEYIAFAGRTTNPMRLQSIVLDANWTHSESSSDEAYGVRIWFFKATAREAVDLGSTGVFTVGDYANYDNFKERAFGLESMMRTTALDLPVQHRIRGTLTLNPGEGIYCVSSTHIPSGFSISNLTMSAMVRYKYVQRDVESGPSLATPNGDNYGQLPMPERAQPSGVPGSSSSALYVPGRESWEPDTQAEADDHYQGDYWEEY